MLIFSTKITRNKRILNSPWFFSDPIGGKFCQLPRVYLAAIHSKYLKGWRNLASPLLWYLYLNFRIHKFGKQNRCHFVNNIFGPLTSANFNWQFSSSVVAKLCLMLSPGGPRSSWIKSGDISQDKERRITCEKFSSVKKENRFVEHLKYRR